MSSSRCLVMVVSASVNLERYPTALAMASSLVTSALFGGALGFEHTVASILLPVLVNCWLYIALDGLDS
eukprot:5644631-Prymnesium_polylepis.1